MNLCSRSVNEYLRLLGSEKAAPGGGSAAALTGALGVALAEMTCRINSKRKSNPDPAASSSRASRLENLRHRLEELVTKDAECFEAITLHWKEKSPLLQRLLQDAADAPLEIARICGQALEITQSESANTSKHLFSDLVESGVVLFGAIKSANLSVEVNLRLIDDESFTSSRRDEMCEILKRAGFISGQIEGMF